MDSVEVAIVGAGPAGLAAAIELADAGLEPLVIDERERAGGQIYRQPPEGFALDAPPQGRYAHGQELLAAASARPIAWRFDTTVWGLFAAAEEVDGADPRAPLARSVGAGIAARDGVALALAGPDAVQRLHARRVLLAPGAYDLPVAFPGWTLPGVLSAGGIQSMLKSQRLLPGRRFVLSGSHPFLLIVADQLLRAGAEIAAIAMPQRPTAGLAARTGWASLPHLAKGGELGPPLLRLRRAGVPLLLGRIVREAVGDGAVEGALVARVDDDWRPDRRSDARIACDAIGFSYGFLASSELARQAGCAHRWRLDRGGWVADRDAWMRTDVDGVSVAGEIAGVAGAEVAELEGRLAAIAILRDAGRIGERDAQRRARPLRARLRGLERFTALVAGLATPKLSALVAAADDATLACRCEEVSFGELRATLREDDHVGTANAVKLLRRSGMGLCQGRFCGHTVTQLVADATGRPPGAVGGFRARAPVRPVRADLLAEAWSRELEEPS